MFEEPNWNNGPFAGWIAATEPNALITPSTMAVDSDSARIVSLIARYGDSFVILDQTGEYGFVRMDSLKVPPATQSSPLPVASSSDNADITILRAALIEHGITEAGRSALEMSRDIWSYASNAESAVDIADKLADANARQGKQTSAAPAPESQNAGNPDPFYGVRETLRSALADLRSSAGEWMAKDDSNAHKEACEAVEAAMFGCDQLSNSFCAKHHHAKGTVTQG